MDKDNTAVNTEESAATSTTDTSESSTEKEDSEAKLTALEAENARLIEETANWKLAALKYKKGKPIEDTESSEDPTDEERLRRIAREELNNSRISQIASEKETLIKKVLKENKELKLAQVNRVSNQVASSGTHSEGQEVKDTLVTNEQLAAFKAKGWRDKDIERYKKNLQRYSFGPTGR